MKSITGIVGVLFIAGCATATRVPLPNNQQGVAIECDKIAQCYKKAQEVCPAGYELVDKSSHTEGDFIKGTGAVSEQQSLIVQCKSVSK